MGEIADMMLDGTMDPETGEFNFDGEDGPGWPMTGAEAAAYRRDARRRQRSADQQGPFTGPTLYRVSGKTRKAIAAIGELRPCSPYHWQVRRGGRLLADWWPHRSKFRIAEKTRHGNEADFLRELSKAAGAPQ